MKNTIFIRNATLLDLEQIVVIHKTAFEGFFLTSLGDSFLKLLYEGFIKKKTGIMRVAYTHDGEVVGFSSGTVSPATFFSELKVEKWLSFTLAALPSLVRSPLIVIKKIVNAFFYKGDVVKKLGRSALLSSLGVTPKMARNGIGQELVIDFELQVKKSQNCDSIYLITDKSGNEKVIKFYHKLNFERESEFTQSSNRKMLRLVKSL